MAETSTQQPNIPVGLIKQFGPYGPEYEILGAATPERGRRMVEIVLVRTGEKLSYDYEAMLEDPEAA